MSSQHLVYRSESFWHSVFRSVDVRSTIGFSLDFQIGFPFGFPSGLRPVYVNVQGFGSVFRSVRIRTRSVYVFHDYIFLKRPHWTGEKHTPKIEKAWTHYGNKSNNSNNDKNEIDDDDDNNRKKNNKTKENLQLLQQQLEIISKSTKPAFCCYPTPLPPPQHILGRVVGVMGSGGAEKRE